MSTVSNKELSRQFRVLGQTISMHASLKSRYERRALTLEILLLACSVVFCATTFAKDEVFERLGLLPDTVHYVLGIASLIAFFASLVALRVDWKGQSIRHKDAVAKLSSVLALFRRFRLEDGSLADDRADELNQSYWEAVNNMVAIPHNQFTVLKARHLRKVEISKMSSSNPGCPVFLLKVVVFCRSIGKFLRGHGDKEN